MKLPSRTRVDPAAPGVVGPARVDRRLATLVPRLRSGDVAVLDQLDLDRHAAQALVDAGVVAVVNAAPMISGRFPNRGPQVLLAAGVEMLDGIGAHGLSAIRDGAVVRLHDGSVWAGGERVADGRRLDADEVDVQLGHARDGLTAQLATLSHNSSEFLRREQGLLLHGEGLPAIHTRLAGRPVVVVADGPDSTRELARIRRYLREVDPVLVAVGTDGVAALTAVKRQPHVVVLDPRAQELPPARVLRAARDIVAVVDPGTARLGDDRLERLGVRPHRLETSATPADAALVLAHAREARVIVAVGVRATLDEFLDRQRPGLASGYLTRLRVGPTLVDATAVPALYSGQLRAVHIWLVLLAGLVAVAAAIAVTPVGHEWMISLGHQLGDLYDATRGSPA